MANHHPTTSREPAAPRDTGALLLAGGGLAAAFAAASCCALPLLLGSFGLGAAWLAGVAWLAAPHRMALLVTAGILLAGGGVLFVWRRRAVAGAPGAACARPVGTLLVASTLAVGAVLAVLGYLYA